MDKPVVCLYGGSFKPPTRAHFEVVQKAANICNEVKVIISNQDREGYNSFLSEKIWNQYKKLLPENVVIQVSNLDSPISEIYDIVKDKTNDYLVVYGKGESGRYNSINEQREKYSNVEILDIGTIENISATKLREAINKRNLKEIKKLIPEGIKIKDFLLNFQLHEISVLKPSLNFPIRSTSKQHSSNIVDMLMKQGYTWMDGSPLQIRDFGENFSLLFHYEITNPSGKRISYGEKINEEKIPGGLSQGKSIVDLAIHHGKDSWASIQFESLEKQLEKQLKKGIEVEMEHTTSKEIAKEIAMDHLWEDPKYYDKLDSIEEIKINEPGLPNKILDILVTLRDKIDIGWYFSKHNIYNSETNDVLFDLEKSSNEDLNNLYKDLKPLIPSNKSSTNEEFLEVINKSLNELFTPENNQSALDKGIEFACEFLQINQPPINLIPDPNYVQQHSSFGSYNPGDKTVTVCVYNRNTADILRSTIHELVHYKQDIEGRLNLEAGKDGDPYENEANAIAGKIMRKIGRTIPEIFE